MTAIGTIPEFMHDSTLKRFVAIGLFSLIVLGCQNNSKSKEIQKDVTPAAPKLYLYYDSIAQTQEPFSYRSMLNTAMSDIDKMIAKEPKNPKLYRLKASLLFQNFKSEKAVSLLEMAEKQFPELHEISLQKSQYLYYLKRYGQAFLELNGILREHPTEAKAYFQLGLIFREQGDSEKAINSLKRATELDADLTDGWIILGDLYGDQGDNTAAHRYYENAVHSDPQSSHAQHALAHWMQANGSIAEALEMYRAILARDSLYQDAYLNAAIIYLEKDSISQAEQLLNRLIYINPNRVKAFYYLAYAAMQQAQYCQALVAIDKALLLDPLIANGQELKDEIMSQIMATER